MFPTSLKPWKHSVKLGEQRGYNSTLKFGRASVGTTYTPVALGGFYRTPQASGATALRVKAGNVADAPGGAGARAILLDGLNASFDRVQEVVPTNGASPGPDSTTLWTRLFRSYVVESGTYATQSAGSHAGQIVIENAAGTEDWATINATGFPYGQTEIACLSIGRGQRALILGAEIYSDASKTTDVLLFRRENIDQTAPPYSAMRALYSSALAGGASVALEFSVPEVVEGPADLGWLAKVDVGTAELNIDFGVEVVDVSEAFL